MWPESSVAEMVISAMYAEAGQKPSVPGGPEDPGTSLDHVPTLVVEPQSHPDLKLLLF